MILFVAFGSVVAMGVPIVAALLSLGASLATIGLAARFLDVSSFTPEFAAMIGLGVGIDYALLVITRMREGLHRGQDVEAAVARAITTAGRSVLFAGTVVVIAMLGLTVIGIPFIGALGISAAIVVGCSVLAALTLLPAVLGVLGHRVDAWSAPVLRTREVGHERTVWFRLSLQIQRRPIWFALGATAVLLVLALPVTRITTGFTDEGNNPPSSHTRRAYDLLTEGFGPGFNGPLIVVADLAGGGQDHVDALHAALAAAPDVQDVAGPVRNPAGDTVLFTIYPASSPQAPQTDALVHDLRTTVIPAATAGSSLRAYVTGQTAAIKDVSDRISARTPYFFAIVIGLSFLVLTWVFRSILIPLKAAVMNLFSIAAAYGVLVAIFQWGWLAGPLGIRQTGPIEAFLPMMMFAIVFGLSMDYEVFLVSRIREEYLSHGDNSRAVAFGLSSTARVITSAALIMIAVFGSFALGTERVIKEFGVGLATAIFVDATIVRLVLVPSLMELVGAANWWLPRSLDRFLPQIGIEGPPAEPAVE